MFIWGQAKQSELEEVVRERSKRKVPKRKRVSRSLGERPNRRDSHITETDLRSFNNRKNIVQNCRINTDVLVALDQLQE